jgi:nucleotide-binding universal stress UspA family protein
MYRHILIPTDGSRLAHKAAVHGLSLAKAVGAQITALIVEPSLMTGRVAEYSKQSREQAALALQAIANEAKVVGVQCETVQVTHNNPSEAILTMATDKACDIIVMASHGQSGIIGMIVGSVTAKVVAEATIPVLVYH